MSVVAAGVHDALVATCVLQPRGLLDRQCIHVRAQAQRALAVATLELPDHTGSAQAALNVVTPVPQSCSHQITGAQLFEWQLGVLMDITAQSDEFVFVCAYRLQGVLNSHAMNSQSAKIRLVIISVVPCHRRFRA